MELQTQISKRTKMQHNFSGNKHVKRASENYHRNQNTTKVAAEIDLKHVLVSGINVSK